MSTGWGALTYVHQTALTPDLTSKGRFADLDRLLIADGELARMWLLRYTPVMKPDHATRF
jgi:hypothetical protein